MCCFKKKMKKVATTFIPFRHPNFLFMSLLFEEEEEGREKAWRVIVIPATTDCRSVVPVNPTRISK